MYSNPPVHSTYRIAVMYVIGFFGFVLFIYFFSKYGLFVLFLFPVFASAIYYFGYTFFVKPNKIKKYRREQYLFETQSSGDFYLGANFDTKEPQAQLIFCPNCGKANAKALFFCETCGSKLRK